MVLKLGGWGGGCLFLTADVLFVNNTRLDSCKSVCSPLNKDGTMSAPPPAVLQWCRIAPGVADAPPQCELVSSQKTDHSRTDQKNEPLSF